MTRHASLRCLAALACLSVSLAAAQQEYALTAEEVAAKKVQANELRSRAKALRQQADATHQQESAACRQVLLVNNCLNQARERRLEKVEEGRAIEVRLNALEQDIRRYDLAERRIERAKKLEQRNLPATISVEGDAALTLPRRNPAGAAK